MDLSIYITSGWGNLQDKNLKTDKFHYNLRN